MNPNKAHTPGVPSPEHIHRSFGSLPWPLDESTLEPWEGPAILLMDLDAFFASVEQMDHPEWKEKPVIVGGDPTKRGVVSTASYEARTYGVHSAMPSSQAVRLCPDAIWVRGNFHRYRELSNAVMEILYAESPHLMQVSIDEAFLDISPTRHNRTHPVVVAKRIQTRVDELGITCSIGLGTSKSIAKIASDMEKPHGVTVVWPGNERAFLSPLPVKLMSGIGPVAQQKLTHYGIRTLGELVAASDDILRPIFGKNTVKMRERAQGIDSAVNDEAEPVKSVSNEISMAENVSTREDVEALIATMAHKVGRRLRRKQLEGTVLHLKVRFANLKIRTCQRQIPDLGTNELTWLPELNSMLDEIWSEGQELRLVGVGVSGIADEQPVQEALFDMPRSQYEGKSALTRNAKDKAALLDASDAIAKRFGESAVRFGHELRTYGGTTGSAAKNPEDYKG